RCPRKKEFFRKRSERGQALWNACLCRQATKWPPDGSGDSTRTGLPAEASACPHRRAQAGVGHNISNDHAQNCLNLSGKGVIYLLMFKRESETRPFGI